MNALRLALLVATAAYAALRIKNPPRARAFGRLVLLLFAAGVMLSPFAWLAAAAFKTRDAYARWLFLPPPSAWGEALSLENFRTLFAGDAGVQGRVPFWRYALNSVFLTCAATAIQLFFAALGGYALAKLPFRGRRVVTGAIVLSFLVPGMLLVAPIYELSVRFGLVDTYWGLLLPGAVSTYGMYLFRQGFASVPDELIEAGRVDGCGELRIFWSLVLPLVRPVSAAFCLVSFLGTWNAYLGPNVLLQSQHKLTLPIVLSLYVAQHYNQQGVFLAGTLLAILPAAALFLTLQRDFVRGLTSGAVKG